DVMSGMDVRIRSLYDESVAAGAPPHAAAIWLTGEVIGWLRRNHVDAADADLRGSDVAELLGLVQEGVISNSAAKEVLDGVLAGEGGPREVAERRDLVQLSDVGLIEEIVDRVLGENDVAVEQYRSGEQKVVGFLVGQVMKASGGKADPKTVNDMLREKMS
ncbi:MAG: Asp-tRNA(Asn)/Glu-tRNA(Gln) amidotransferase GatCAB subunit B, partial [Acidimicrobiia bacterium]